MLGLSTLLALVSPLRTVAEAPAATMPVYVSDEFKAVARRVLHQFIATQIENACPNDRAFCEATVRELAAAFAAAVEGDEARLRDALSSFFVVASTSGLLEQILGDLLPEGARALPGVSASLVPVARCLSKLVAGQRVGKACDLTEKEREAALGALGAFVPAGDLQPLRDALLDAHASIEPAAIARGLSRVVAGERIARPDIAFYLDRLAAFLETGIEGGLFDAAMVFLANQVVTEEERAILDDDFEAFALLAPDGDAGSIRDALRACDQPVQPLDEWFAAMAKPEVRSRMRRALVLEDSLALAPLHELSEYACPASRDQKGLVASLRSQALRLLAPLETQPVLRRYGLVALVGAALVDFARTGDRPLLERSLRRALLFGVAQVVRYAAISRAFADGKFTSLTYLSVQDVMGSCELQYLAAALGEPYPAPRAESAGCYALIDAAPDRRPFPRELAAGKEIAAARSIPPALIDPSRREPVELPGSPHAPTLEAARRFVTLLLAERSRRGGGGDQQAFFGTIADDADPAHRSDWTSLKDALTALVDRPADLEQRKKLQDLAAAMAATVPKAGHKMVRPIFLRHLLRRLDDSKTKLDVPGTPRLLRLEPGGPNGGRILLAASRLAGSLAALENMPASILENMPASMRSTARQVGRALSALAQERPDELRAALVRQGADFLADQVGTLASRIVGGSYADCEAMVRRRSIFCGPDAACAAQVLVRAAYQPVVDFVEQGARSAGATKLADGVYRELMESPALSSTPVIFNVGLGANLVAGPDRFAALTVLDKIGVAFLKITDPRWQFEMGPFAGGFLDALVRTAAGEGKDRRYWLLGYTVGFPRIGGFDLGLEVHAGAAMPFSSGSGPVRFVAGGALVVPFSVVFDKSRGAP